MGPINYQGKTKDFAAGWEGLQASIKALGISLLQGLELVIAGMACAIDIGTICSQASDTVDFTMSLSAVRKAEASAKQPPPLNPPVEIPAGGGGGGGTVVVGPLQPAGPPSHDRDK